MNVARATTYGYWKFKCSSMSRRRVSVISAESEQNRLPTGGGGGKTWSILDSRHMFSGGWLIGIKAIVAVLSAGDDQSFCAQNRSSPPSIDSLTRLMRPGIIMSTCTAACSLERGVD